MWGCWPEVVVLGVFGAVAVAGPVCAGGRKCRLSTWPGAAEHRWSSAQDSMYCFGFNSAKEREKTEGEQCKARSSEGVSGACSPARGAGNPGICRASPGTQREPGHSLAKAPSHPGPETDPGKGPRVLLQHCRDPHSATWESIPCLLLVPRIYNTFTIYNGSISPCSSPAS